MKNALVYFSLLALAVTPVFGQTTVAVIDSFEDGVAEDTWVFTDFDSYALASELGITDGITDGSDALVVDVKPGWQQGLVSTDWGATVPSDPSVFFPMMNQGTQLAFDVTSNQSFFNYPGGGAFQFALFIQGGDGDDNSLAPSQLQGSEPNTVDGYHEVTAIYAGGEEMVTQTIVFDYAYLVDGDPSNGELPPFADPTDGWWDVRIHTNVTDNIADPALVIIDNIRVMIEDEQGHNVLYPGDYNEDYFVDGLDYLTWANAFGETIDAFYGADGNGDGVVDGLDYLTWAREFGTAYTAPTPEPATMALLGLGGLGLLRRRR